MIYTKPKVFVSSTIVDLPSERAAALEAVGLVNCIPIMSEHTMEAEDTDSVEACLNKVLECDIYILICGGRYGWKPNGGTKSITEMEYETAIKADKARLVYITPYSKEKEQEEFIERVQSERFRKNVGNAQELKSEMIRSLQKIIQIRQQEYFNSTETIYSNLIEISFPPVLYQGNIDIDKDAVSAYWKKESKFYNHPTLHDYVCGSLYSKGLKFPFDWHLFGRSMLTFHNLLDDKHPLKKAVINDSITKSSPEEFFNQSDDHLNAFKALLNKCLSKKLHDLNFKWFKEERLYSFMPNKKDLLGKHNSLKLSWTKTTKNATRTVVDVTRKKDNPNEVFKMKHLSFRVNFHFIDKKWYVAIKPDWLFTYGNFVVSQYGHENIAFLKKLEKNQHVFNHLNFILHMLQPAYEESVVPEFQDYPFLKLKNFLTEQSAPIIPDSIWAGAEERKAQAKLIDKKGDVNLFSK
jgi:hypothetical protein